MTRAFRLPRFALAIAASFAALVALTIYLAATGIVTPQQGLLMLIALAGLYIGFGILILVRRLIDKLD